MDIFDASQVHHNLAMAISRKTGGLILQLGTNTKASSKIDTDWQKDQAGFNKKITKM